MVGGGSTGVESVGFMADKYGEDKKIGICQRGSKLLAQIEGGHERILPHLEKIGVNLHLN